MQLSNKVLSMPNSPIRKFNIFSTEAQQRGKKVYPLNIGQPDLETPGCFMEAIRNFDEKVIAYAESGGMVQLQDAISNYFNRYGMDYERKQIIVTNGGSEALSMVTMSILNPGDHILIAEPFYANYHEFVGAAGGTLVPITTKAEEGYQYTDKERILKAITPKTKAILCTNPGNPTGYVLTREEMETIGDIAIEYDLWIIADEVYREFIYDNRKVTSFGMIDDLSNRVILVDSVSKRFSACGARIGCLVTKNEELLKSMMKIAQGRLCAPTLEQVGATALFKLEDDYYHKVRGEYEGRRDAAYEELMKIPGVICRKPGGAFYMMAKLPVDNIEKFLMFLLTQFEDKNETVMFAPAEGFYSTPGLGRNEMRVAYVLNKEDMARGVELIRLGIEAYNRKK